ncbi:acyltransferase 3 [Macrophomina phaseolina]|uniref:Acyltransferase 3 n=1 Tax=Macrophomina phaseolina TaxID=35725 RepID=A0ABQ8GW44_9PEZI|nr:acyltransferase 3 [Macrophomina phaseolina]
MNWQKLLALGPSGPAFPRALWSKPIKDVSTTAWVDGVRGLAALIVTVNHLAWHVIGPLFQGYKAFPPEEHSSIFQLPGLRIIFGARAMVPLFFVISGYCISLSSIRARNGIHDTTTDATTAAAAALLSTLSNTVFRRAIRLMVPVLAITLLSQLVYALGGYSAWPLRDDRDTLPTGPSQSSPLAHAAYLVAYWGSLFDQVLTGRRCAGTGSRDCPVGLNGQVWTIPLELRGSLLVYLCVLGLARVRHAPRVWALAALAAAMLARAWWEAATFVAGLLIAEVTQGGGGGNASTVAEGGCARRGGVEQGEDLLLAVVSPSCPPSSPLAPAAWRPRWHRDHCQRRRPGLRAGRRRRNAAAAVLAFVGVWLLCFPNDPDVLGGYGPCYDFLFTRLAPARWLVGDGPPRAEFCWRAVGGMAFVAALAGDGAWSALLRRPFSSAAAQYFGRISFMLYLVHIMVFESLLLRLQLPLTLVLGADRRGLAGGIARITLLPLVFWLSEVLVEVVDKRSVAWAKRLSESWLAFPPGR